MENSDRPITGTAGRSLLRERRWGIIGGLVGTFFGVGSALIAVYVEGASWAESPYPAFFSRRQLLPYDGFLLCGLAVGFGFLVTALLLCRWGRYPRSDATGALLIGLILSALGATLMLTRLLAIIRAV